MIKSLIVCITPICAQYAAPSYSYGPAPAPAPATYHHVAPAPAAYHQYAPAAAPAYGAYHAPRFSAPAAVIDPHYYQEVLTGFTQCVHHECKKLPKTYSEDAASSIATLGEYTACVTSCAAGEMMRVTVDLKQLIGKLIDIGSAQLASSHRYLAGREEYGVLENNTHIAHSCCLPKDYFVNWKELVFKANVNFPGETPFELFISAKGYLDYCAQKNGNELHLGKLEIACDVDWIKYLTDLQLNVGHLILAPKCKRLAPPNACTYKEENNPQSEAFGEDMCVAYESVRHGKSHAMPVPLLKYPTAQINYHDSCEDDSYSGAVIKYRRVPRHHVEYYTLSTGLPSAYASSVCSYGQGLVNTAVNGRFELLATAPLAAATASLQDCPKNGRFEYCNMKQYVHWLQTQLFDLSGCSINFHADSSEEEEENSPYGYYTLACLYRVISLKCDCMEAVLNCYDREYKFSTDIGKTLGKAASVLCGFILCQKPKVYYLLGGHQAIEHANIMKQILMQVGALASPDHSLPPVTFAFLAFGAGMLVFVASKASMHRMKNMVSVEDGYRNLI